MKINSQHQLSAAQQVPSPFYNQRPGCEPSLLVIHCISLPEGQYNNGHIDALFSGCLDCSLDASFADLAGLEVSAHLLITREGELKQYVPFNLRAWHAGVSSFEGREACNDYSIGIELEGTDSSEFTTEQYFSLQQVTKALLAHYPQLSKQRIVAHSEIAPGRKTDPGSGFDWAVYLNGL
ncbi:1,6-anhydro-N-acetylmuramyl-L-alanine amidase AmpD [Agarivorans sp. MS3-6]